MDGTCQGRTWREDATIDTRRALTDTIESIVLPLHDCPGIVLERHATVVVAVSAYNTMHHLLTSSHTTVNSMPDIRLR